MFSLAIVIVIVVHAVMYNKQAKKLRGYYNYYGVRGNYDSLNEFFQLVQRLHLKWLNRRSQRQSYT